MKKTNTGDSWNAYDYVLLVRNVFSKLEQETATGVIASCRFETHTGLRCS